MFSLKFLVSLLLYLLLGGLILNFLIKTVFLCDNIFAGGHVYILHLLMLRDIVLSWAGTHLVMLIWY